MRRAASAVIEFVVGDDVWAAAGIALTLGAAGLVARTGLDPWWLVAPAVPLVLGWSLRRAIRS